MSMYGHLIKTFMDLKKKKLRNIIEDIRTLSTESTISNKEKTCNLKYQSKKPITLA